MTEDLRNPSDELVERVAEAIAIVTGDNDAVEDAWEDWVDEARAAIAAIAPFVEDVVASWHDALIAKMETHVSRYPNQMGYDVFEKLDSPDDELLLFSDDMGTRSVGGEVARYLRTLRPGGGEG